MSTSRTPFKYFKHNFYRDIRGPNGRVTTFDGTDKDAEFVVTSCNSHDALTSSLETALDELWSQSDLSLEDFTKLWADEYEALAAAKSPKVQS